VTHHIRWQILLILLGVALVGILLSYLAVNYTTVVRPGHGGTYVEGVAGSPHYLNPLLSGYNQVDSEICALVFSGLTRLNESGEVEVDLARKWQVSLDGLSYTFYLRSNAYWHDGNPVTSDDVIFTLNLIRDPDFPGPADVGAAIWQSATIEKIDRHTVRFTLAEPFAPFLDYTTFGLLPAHLLRGTRAADLARAESNLAPVGTGPFQVEEIEIAEGAVSAMVLKSFPRYYGSQPFLGRVQFRFFPSHQTLIDAYEQGQVDGVARVLPADLARATILSDLDLFSAPIAEYGLVLLNLDRPNLPFFREKEVRQAMLYAVDRQQVIDEILQGQALVAHSPLIPGTWAYNDDVRRYDHDPEAAEDLLNEANWRIRRTIGDGVRRKGEQALAFTLLTSSEPERVGAAQMLAEQWAAVGITATVSAISPAEVRASLEARDFDAILIHVALPGDPDPYPFWHQTQIDNGQNYAGLDHRRISELIEQTRVIVDRERRQQLYHEFQETFAEDVPALLLYVPIYTYGVDGHINAVQIAPMTQSADRFRTIADWWIVPRRVFVSEAEAR
jgi:peptide/nickel transport system substrate-binding protein